MSIIDIYRAETFSKILPICIREEVLKEQPIWKEAILKNLPIALSGTDVRAIRFWLGLLGLYNSTELFTFTKSELEIILNCLFDFVVSTRFLSYAMSAATTFIDLTEHIYEKLDFTLDLRRLYDILYKFGLSHSKIKKRITPDNYLLTMIMFTSTCRRFFSEDSTEEILQQWPHLIDPQTPLFSVSVSLLCLLLPVAHQKHNLWVDYLLKIWSYYSTVVANCIFMPVFVRLSSHNLEEFDWSPYVPIFFQKLCLFIGIPVSPIDQETDARVNLSTSRGEFMFGQPMTTTDISMHFAILFVRLLSTSAKEVVKDHLLRLIHLLEPLHSPFPQTDNANTVAQAISFLNALVAAYAQRVKADRRKKLKLPPLDEDDHIWFLNLILPLYLLELYHAESACEQLGQLVQLMPSLAIPPVYDAFSRLSEYTHLKAPALRTMAAVAPTILTTGIMEAEFLNVVVNFVDEISAMDILKSQWIFTLYEAVLWSKKIDESMTNWAITLIRKCIEFAMTAVSEEFNDCMGTMELMLSAFSMSINNNLRETVEDILKESIETMPISNLSRFIDSIIPTSFGKFCFNEVNEKNLTIIKCLVRSSKDFALKYDFDKVVFEGLNSPLKKVKMQACALIKWILRFHSLVFPFLPKRQGISNISEDSISWHIPKESDFEACAQLVDKCIPVMQEMFTKEDKRSKLTAVTIAYSIIQGIIGAVSPLDFNVAECDPLFTAPTVSTIHSPELSKRYSIVAEWLLSIASNDLHEEVSSLIIKTFTTMITPVDPIAMRADSISDQFDAFCAASKQGVLFPTLQCMFPNHHYWLALKLYSGFTQLIDMPINELTTKIILKVFLYAVNPLPSVREKCDVFMAQSALFYGIELADLFPRLMDIFNDCFLLTVDQLSTISVFMSDFIQVANPATQFNLISQIAVNLCRQLPLDVPNDNLRALRNDIVRVIDNFDFSTAPLDTDQIYEERKQIIYSSIQRSDLFSTSAETQNYAVALVCSVLMGKKPVIEPDVFEFLSSMFLSDDMSVRSVSIQVFGSTLELLIPRVDRTIEKIEYDQITPENYDTFAFKDNKVKLKKTRMSRLLTKTEAFDENCIKQFFPDDYENRVDIHKTLYQIFFDNDAEFVHKLCQVFVNSQTHGKESFSLENYSFWIAIIRFFGTPMMLKLLDISTDYLSKEPQGAHLFTASEIVAAIFSSTVYFKFKDIQPIFDKMYNFLNAALCGNECDTSFSWFVVLFGVICDLDPRRFFWLFEYLKDLHPDIDNHGRSKYVRQDTEICLQLIFAASKTPEKMMQVIEQRFPSYFQADQLEISRSAVIQVLISVSQVCCRIPYNNDWQNVFKTVFNEYILKTDPKFISRWICEQFDQVSFGSLSAVPLCVEKLRDFVLIEMENDEDSMSFLHNGIIGIIRTNMFIPDSSKEKIDATIKNIIQQLDPTNLPWPKQVLMLSLFIELIKEMFFYISEESIDYIIKNITLPALEHSNPDVADTASVLLSFILKIDVKVRENISDYVERFTRMLNNGENRLAGAKGLFAVVWSTLIFDDVPQFVIDAFMTITSGHWNDSVLEDNINQFISDFWNVHDNNLTKNGQEILSPFRSNMMPSYIS
ncbi:hypothetical protein TRFO_10380 [Tritrichomonas foetus]|uniref:Proteasome activator complex subunit 4-like HEAT repeat-like domain-containing protein n=1 Tax=Tritrichomonas foetus TaxID=1144522 RepID=A0A1J4JAM9_9EUKA|nr:hypothetical protein TRFO_10380 [Tritrichomonas foetus]|eukprot:OHS95729.1 hypothetical protein TRFO_10380 [Tritrichomonas foetus]